jgi:hypothetical protein
MVRHALGFLGRGVMSEQHSITEDGTRNWGVMMLQFDYGGDDAVALRNSRDKEFPVGVGSGGHVFTRSRLSPRYASTLFNRRCSVGVPCFGCALADSWAALFFRASGGARSVRVRAGTRATRHRQVCAAPADPSSSKTA